MDPKEYIKKAIRTESPAVGAMERIINNNKLRYTLVNVMQKMINNGSDLDKLKKITFYNKDDSSLKNARFMPDRRWDGLEFMDETFTRVLHGVMGVATESSELLQALICIGDHDEIERRDDIDVVNIAEEIGDVLWYLAIICDALDFDLSELMDRNIRKLQGRFPEKFDEDLAENRDLENERNILEQDDPKDE